MGKIKSALELALERTADVSIDRDAVRKDGIIREGKAAAGRHLSDPASASLKSVLESRSGEEGHWFKQGALDAVLANFTLPRHETDLNRLRRISDILRSLGAEHGPGAKLLGKLLDRCAVLLQQYMEDTAQLETQLRKQWQPRLQQKEELIRQQTGQSMRLSPEQDAEFVKTLSDELSRLDTQYAEMINGGKSEIRSIILSG